MLKEFDIYKVDSQLAYGGVIIKYLFINGYGASIAKHKQSRGYEKDKWELAILKDDEITYDTPITDDILDWLSEEDVKEVLEQIIRLED